MDEILKKWKEDKKYQAKIKLILYGIFIVLVVLYVSVINHNTPESTNEKELVDTTKEKNNTSEEETTTPIVYFPDMSRLNATINLDDKIYEYRIEKLLGTLYIAKVGEPNIKYIYKDNEYYIDRTDTKVTEEEVYDVIDGKYLDIDNINRYLQKANKYGDDYYVYLRDILEDDNSDEYITITPSAYSASIDYTSLMKKLNNNYKCTVNISIELLETYNE